MDVSFEDIDAAIMTCCPKENDNNNIELYCNSIRNALARAKADIIDRDAIEKEHKKFKNYLVKREDVYDWFTIDIIYSVLRSIYDCTSEDGKDFTLFDRQVRALASIKHFEDTIDATEAYYKHKDYLNRVNTYNQQDMEGELNNSPSTDDMLSKYRQPYAKEWWYRY